MKIKKIKIRFKNIKKDKQFKRIQTLKKHKRLKEIEGIKNQVN